MDFFTMPPLRLPLSRTILRFHKKLAKTLEGMAAHGMHPPLVMYTQYEFVAWVGDAHTGIIMPSLSRCGSIHAVTRAPPVFHQRRHLGLFAVAPVVVGAFRPI